MFSLRLTPVVTSVAVKQVNVQDCRSNLLCLCLKQAARTLLWWGSNALHAATSRPAHTWGYIHDCCLIIIVACYEFIRGRSPRQSYRSLALQQTNPALLSGR